jgi:superfamily I DNA/RNA helicase
LKSNKQALQSEASFFFYRDDKKQGSVWPAYDLPSSRQGIDSIVVDKDQGAEMPPGAIRLATLHRAKGLEFDRVVVIGHKLALGPVEETAQERSLLYVALTRARREGAMVFV